MSLLKQTAKNLRRSPYQALAAILVLTLTFFLATLFILLALSSHRLLSYFQSRPQVSVFFKDEATQEQIEAIKSELLSTGQVTDVKFVSKEEALAIYREQNKEDPLLLELVTADILPASLEISAKNPRELSQIAEVVKSKGEVEEVVFQKDVVDRLTSWINGLRIGGGILVGFLIFVSLTIILMITAMRIATRREEISIMRLVGATPWYIRWPFIFEGLTYGLVGSFVGTLVVYILLFIWRPFLLGFFEGLPFFPISLIAFVVVFFIQIFFGILLGSLGSFLAVYRYLR